MTLQRSVACVLLVLSIAARHPAFAQEEGPFEPQIPKVWTSRSWLPGQPRLPDSTSGLDTSRKPTITRRRWTITAPIRYTPQGASPRATGRCYKKSGPTLIDKSKLRTKHDWIQAGQAVFEQADHCHFEAVIRGDRRDSFSGNVEEPAVRVP
jgi:hypothetical protein